MRRLPIAPKGVQPGYDASGPFNQWNQGKKSLQLNVRKAEGLALAKQLIQHSDVVIDNFATGVMDGLGLGYDELKKLKPELIVVSISGYGHTGPLKAYMGYGPAIPPLTGLSALTGYQGGPPQELGVSIGDPNAGITAAAAVCAALAARQRTGLGQYIDVALWSAATVLAAEGWMEYAMNGTEPPRQGNRDIWMAPHNCFRCQGEDAWVAIALAPKKSPGVVSGMDQTSHKTHPHLGTATTLRSNKERWDFNRQGVLAHKGRRNIPLGDHQSEAAVSVSPR